MSPSDEFTSGRPVSLDSGHQLRSRRLDVLEESVGVVDDVGVDRDANPKLVAVGQQSMISAILPTPVMNGCTANSFEPSRYIGTGEPGTLVTARLR